MRLRPRSAPSTAILKSKEEMAAQNAEPLDDLYGVYFFTAVVRSLLSRGDLYPHKPPHSYELPRLPMEDNSNLYNLDKRNFFNPASGWISKRSLGGVMRSTTLGSSFSKLTGNGCSGCTERSKFSSGV